MKKLLSLIVLSLFMMTGLAWAQANESFTNLADDSGNHGQYLSRSWTGDDGVTWTAEGVRLDEALNGLAICFGQTKHNPRTLTSPTYSGGMGILKFNYVRGFTSDSGRKLEVYVNNQKIGNDITVNATSDNVVTYNEIINIEGDVVLEIRSTGSAQVIIDDIEWTAYEATDPNQPALTVNPESLSGFGYEVGSSESQSQQFRVLSVNIDKDIVITAPANYKLSLNNIFSDPKSVITARITDGSETFYVRLEPGLPVGQYNDNITIAPENPVNGISEVAVSLSGEVTEVIPEVTLDKTSLSGFSYTQNNGPSEDLSFTIEGKGIQDYIAVTLGLGANSPFELRIEDEQDYWNSLALENVETHIINTKIYIRLKEGLSTGQYSDTIEFTCSDVSGSIPSIVLSGAVYDAPPTGGYFIDFEEETKGAYASATVALNGLDWDMTEALIGGNEPNDWKIGEKSARLRGYGTSAMTMLEDKKNGLGTLSFYYRRYGINVQVDWKVEYSTDQGANWYQIGSDFTALASDEVQEFKEDLNITGDVRVRIKRATESGTDNRRLCIDNIFMTDYTAYDYTEKDPINIPEIGTITFTTGNANNSGATMPDMPNPNITAGDYEGLSLGLVGNGPWAIEIVSGFAHCAYNWQGGWHDATSISGGFEIEIASIAKGSNNLFIVLSQQDPTLPVELSSFMVVLNSSGNPVVTWETQTETGVNGFYIYRGVSKNLDEAILISSLVPATNSSLEHSYSFVDTELTEEGTYYYWLNVSDLNGHQSYHGPAELNFTFGEEEDIPEVIYTTSLRSIYPNPFNPNANIGFELAESSEVAISVYNARGQLVRSFAPFTHGAGYGSIVWDGKDEGGSSVSSGIYLFRMTVGTKSFSAKALMLK